MKIASELARQLWAMEQRALEALMAQVASLGDAFAIDPAAGAAGGSGPMAEAPSESLMSIGNGDAMIRTGHQHGLP